MKGVALITHKPKTLYCPEFGSVIFPWPQLLTQSLSKRDAHTLVVLGWQVATHGTRLCVPHCGLDIPDGGNNFTHSNVAWDVARKFGYVHDKQTSKRK